MPNRVESALRASNKIGRSTRAVELTASTRDRPHFIFPSGCSLSYQRSFSGGRAGRVCWWQSALPALIS